jgi:hypothetical protein
MVAVIHASSSLRNALNYNEQKVKQHVATCLAAVNYPKDVEDLTFYQKLNRLQNQADLNTKTKVNSVHISLNFDPSERLSEEKIKEISDTYLQKIGFANQPYLLYQHHDAGHPHVHIVTTNIKADGKRIELHNLGKIQSEKARKEIEIDYNLVKAENMKTKPYELKSAYNQKVQYGKADSRRAIANVLDGVLNSYKYSSVAELNAVLQQYNVLADRGSEGSRVYQNHGLFYRILDEKGNTIGVPIKASSFHNKPTLKYLEERFAANNSARQTYKARVKNAIDLALLKQPKKPLESLVTSLEKEGIKAILRQNKEGLVYGVTYVDHKTKCVFNGSDLGKQYSAKGIQERCSNASAPKLNEDAPHQHTTHHQAKSNQHNYKAQNTIKDILPASNIDKLVDDLIQPTQGGSYVPHQLKKNKKKKRKKISNNI